MNNYPMRRNNVPNLVKSVENNIENFRNNRNYGNMQQYNQQPPMPVPQIQPQQLPRNQYITQQPLPPTYRGLVPPKYNNSRPVFKKTGGFLNGVKKCLNGIKYYAILICLFSILSYRSVRRFVENNIPFVNQYDSEIPSILFRSGVFVILLMILNRLI